MGKARDSARIQRGSLIVVPKEADLGSYSRATNRFDTDSVGTPR
ncbi:unnamed protein product [Protopolystoma xenopodis]|uniref:Uncharacterized protein n=1 Tax=Protopolystoma xenopodis TaxID=117903 RepID=A0A3S5CDJ2_9PLAT|nr:unnamed protein product [Protopolystoma xenopodis]